MKNKNKYNTRKRKLERLKWQLVLGSFILGVMVITIHSIMVKTEIVLANEYQAPVRQEVRYVPVEEYKLNPPTKEQVIEEIKIQSAVFGVDTELALRIAECESGFNYKAKNPNSTARGVYQYLIATWEATELAKQGYERNNYKANIREAMIDLANGEIGKWNASKKCWGK